MPRACHVSPPPSPPRILAFFFFCPLGWGAWSNSGGLQLFNSIYLIGAQYYSAQSCQGFELLQPVGMSYSAHWTETGGWGKIRKNFRSVAVRSDVDTELDVLSQLVSATVFSNARKSKPEVFPTSPFPQPKYNITRSPKRQPVIGNKLFG